eukprot:TRINITY_DN4963_c0_g4_i10.p1 TRINITY_DN4963_c0_g4~~TRINITY_DN4963_c0_g4_i10.p1  ORF type:complete len:965 (-),score=237.06 TRINITY_DN4963_c0_g4_i10:2105-4999(-)
MASASSNLPDYLLKDDGIVYKSPLDVHSYRIVNLDNGLVAILASNPKTEKAAASMDVGVGNFCDPENVPGIAHFLEHMLFLGTEKYPSEKEYSDYLSKNGGSCNAWTDIENTNYMFDVGSDHLEGALDRFAQFFISPLFTESATLRELNAVDSEHRKNLLQDYWRLMQLDRTCSNPDHPFHKFGTGSLATLKDQPEADGLVIMDILKKFHADYYSANIMKLAIVGKDSLDVMEAWVREKFSPIVNKNVVVPIGNGVPYVEDDLQLVFKVTPVKDLQLVTLTWRLPASLHYYKQKPLRYLSHLIGHEGPGSILSYLKKQGWADSLSAGTTRSTRDFTLFGVEVSLSEDGLQNVDKVIAAVFQYIRLVLKEGIQEWIWNECRDISSIKFRFADRTEPYSYVSTLSHQLQFYELEYSIIGSHLYTVYDDALIRDFATYLTPENVRIVIISKTFEDSTPLREKWYQTPYSKDKISKEQMKLYLEDAAEGLFITAKNPFIPENLELKQDLESKDEPSLVYDSKELKIWYKPSLKFKQPKAVVNLQIFSPLCYSSPRNVVLTNLFMDLLVDAVNELTYFAELAGLAYNFGRTIMGMELTVSGFNDNIAKLLHILIEKASTLHVTEERFILYKEQAIREYANFAKSQPYNVARHNEAHMLFTVKWHNDDLLEEATAVTVSDMQAYAAQFSSCVEMTVFVNGNMYQEEAVTLAKELRAHLGKKSPTSSQHLYRRLIRLQPGIESIYRIPATNKQDENSAITVYLQGDRGQLEFQADNLRENALCQFLGHLMEKDAFHQLRTVEQLGYMVWSGCRSDLGVPSIYFIIQSPTKDAVHLNERIENFIEKYWEILAETTPESFESSRKGLIVKKLEEDKTIKKESNRLWNEIAGGLNRFKRQQEEVQELETITKEELMEFYKHVVMSHETRRKLTVELFGGDKSLPAAAESSEKIRYIENIDVFRARTPLYPSVMN